MRNSKTPLTKDLKTKTKKIKNIVSTTTTTVEKQKYRNTVAAASYMYPGALFKKERKKKEKGALMQMGMVIMLIGIYLLPRFPQIIQIRIELKRAMNGCE